jgi:hypothetical protein
LTDKVIPSIALTCCNYHRNPQQEVKMIDQTAIKRRDMLLVTSSMLAATAMSAMPAAAQTPTPSKSKSESGIPASSAQPDKPCESASRGRRFS